MNTRGGNRARNNGNRNRSNNEDIIQKVNDGFAVDGKGLEEILNDLQQRVNGNATMEEVLEKVDAIVSKTVNQFMEQHKAELAGGNIDQYESSSGQSDKENQQPNSRSSGINYLKEGGIDFKKIDPVLEW